MHLELLRTLTTDEFLCAFRKFVARQGKPTRVISDNAKHFQLAAKILGAEVRGLGGQREERRDREKGKGRSELRRYMDENAIDWKFIQRCLHGWGVFMKDWWVW